MKNRFFCNYFGLLSLVVLLLGCASIKTYEDIRPNIGGPYRAFVGSKIYSINVTQDLPNAFGGADIFGGKIDKGKKELTFLGMADDGFLIFNFYEVEIRSNETTMSRYGTTTITANTNYSRNSSQTNITVREPPQSYIHQLPPNSRTFGFDPNVLNIFSMDGIVIEIHEFSNNSITYSLYRENN
jgi:hypothetical protein